MSTWLRASSTTSPHDQLGLRAVWINRLGEASDLPRAAELKDLSRLPDVLDELVLAL